MEHSCVLNILILYCSSKMQRNITIISSQICSLAKETQELFTLQNITEERVQDDYLLRIRNMIQKQLSMIDALIDKRAELICNGLLDAHSTYMEMETDISDTE